MTIITAAEIQKGDLIRVTRDQTCEDRKGAYVQEGVAAEFTFGKWGTAKGWRFFTDFENAVIELLDRPKPKIELPTGIGAVVEYQRFGHDAGYGGRRVATRLKKGDWRIYGVSFATGTLRECDFYSRQTHEQFTELLNDSSRTSDFKVLFEGVKK